MCNIKRLYCNLQAKTSLTTMQLFVVSSRKCHSIKNNLFILSNMYFSLSFSPEYVSLFMFYLCAGEDAHLYIHVKAKA